jgi:hypothetical protein
VRCNTRICLALLRSGICAIALLAPLVASAGALSAPAVYLGDLTPLYSTQGWGQLQVDHSVQGNPLRIGDQRYARGLGTHAQSEILYDLNRSYVRFESWVGIDAEMLAQPKASVVFKVFVDNEERFNSGIMRASSKPQKVSIPVAGKSELRLVVTDGGDGSDCDHADWAEARLIQSGSILPKPKVRFRVTSPGLTLGLTDRGEISEATIGAGRLRVNLSGYSRLLGSRALGKTTSSQRTKSKQRQNLCFGARCLRRSTLANTGFGAKDEPTKHRDELYPEPASRKLPGGGIEFTREMAHSAGEKCRVIERFVPTRSSIRWEVEILGNGAPWTTPISFRLRWPKPSDARFWAPWDDPEMTGAEWHDPLVAKPFANKMMWLGAPPVGPDPQVALVYSGGDCLSIPMATVLLQSADLGLSLVLSPQDTYLDTSLTTGADGSIVFSHMNNRISAAKPLRFSADLVAHEADWRSGLGWMVNRYPKYFNPPNPNADDIAGCAAYSTWEGDLDVAKLRKMAFRVNWKASYDFPFCGMFIPPVKDDSETWPRFAADTTGSATGAQSTTSIAQLEAYSRKMRSWGFHVLSFFNVTEVGLGLPGVAYP